MTLKSRLPAGQELSRQCLAGRFRAQAEFSRDSSPLYARLFGLVAGWLQNPKDEDETLVTWLLAAGRHRRSLDVTLLLAAGLHREVLASQPTTTALGRFFPTAGGAEPPESAGFETVLRQAILARRHVLADFIRNAQVQTNETGRGLCWLLPLLLTGWPAVRLVDLGASAGLNLVAEQRAYRLLDGVTGATLLDLGLADPLQFQTRCYGRRPDFSGVDGRAMPRFVARDGTDLAPFPLQNRADELTLMAFIWGDQPDRLARLQEGIAAYKWIGHSAAPVRVVPAELPDELGRYLQRTSTDDDPEIPAVIYNTWMTSYLRDNGQSMAYHIEQWAAGQKRPVLWLQWEPASNIQRASKVQPARDEARPARYGWCDWTADLWRGDDHSRWHFGRAHPHGGEAELSAGLDEWRRFWSEL